MYVMDMRSYAVQSLEHAYFQPYSIQTNSHLRSQQEKAHLASVGQFSQGRGLPWVMFILASDAAFRSNMSLLMYTLVRHAGPFINHQPASSISQGKMTSEVDKIAFITIKIAHTLNPNKLNTQATICLRSN